MMEDNRYTRQTDGKVVILAPSTARVRSYHLNGSSKELFMRAREAFKTAGGRSRAKKRVLQG